MTHVDILVRYEASLASLRPVSGGVPITEGAAPQGSRFLLHDADELGVGPAAGHHLAVSNGDEPATVFFLKARVIDRSLGHHRLGHGHLLPGVMIPLFGRPCKRHATCRRGALGSGQVNPLRPRDGDDAGVGVEVLPVRGCDVFGRDPVLTAPRQKGRFAFLAQLHRRGN